MVIVSVAVSRPWGREVSMSLVYAYQSDTGQTRQHNEDYIWVNGEAGIFIVADGVGGQEAGEMASRLTATTVAQQITAGINTGAGPLTPAEIEKLLLRALEVSNETVLAAAQKEGQLRQMGSTIVVVLVQLPSVYICHAGDTRAYLVHGGALTQLTEDDSYVAELVAAGVISKEDAKSHPYTSVITKAIGQDPPLEPTFAQLQVESGDWLLLCSDGLTNMVSEEEMLAQVKKSKGSPDYVVKTLTNAANEAGGRDNISIVAIRVLPEEK